MVGVFHQHPANASVRTPGLATDASPVNSGPLIVRVVFSIQWVALALAATKTGKATTVILVALTRNSVTVAL
jgi:hypothetical protein